MANKSQRQDNAATWATLSERWSVRPSTWLFSFRGGLVGIEMARWFGPLTGCSYGLHILFMWSDSTWDLRSSRTSICYRCFLLRSSGDGLDETTIPGRVNMFLCYPEANLQHINPAEWKWCESSTRFIITWHWMFFKTTKLCITDITLFNVYVDNIQWSRVNDKCKRSLWQ